MDERIRVAIQKGLLTPIPGRNVWDWPLLVPKRVGPVMTQLLDCLTALDEAFLRARPSTPWLYESGCWYEREPPGQERWLTIPMCLLARDQGKGIDCEDAACWRAAELRIRRGENAKAVHVTAQSKKTGHKLYHIRTRHPNGRVEDPSMALGMGREWMQFYGPRHSITDGDKY